jgi:hypothetical protein
MALYVGGNRRWCTGGGGLRMRGDGICFSLQATHLIKASHFFSVDSLLILPKHVFSTVNSLLRLPKHVFSLEKFQHLIQKSTTKHSHNFPNQET